MLMSSLPSRMSTSLKKTPRHEITCPLFLKLTAPHVHSLINQNQCLSLPEVSVIGSLTMNIQLVPILWKCSKTHSGILLCLCHLHSVPCCAVVNGTCYIIGGSKSGGLPNRQVCFVSIPSLLPTDTDHPESSKAATLSPK